MVEIKPAWDFLSPKQRQLMINEIISYFLTERNETIGVVAAENILDFFLQTSGSLIYNKAVDDARLFLGKKFEDTLLDIDISMRRQIDPKKNSK